MGNFKPRNGSNYNNKTHNFVMIVTSFNRVFRFFFVFVLVKVINTELFFLVVRPLVDPELAF